MRLFVIGLCLFGLSGLAQERTNHWRAAVGVDFSSGDYGDEVDTEIIFVPLSLSHTRGPMTFRVVLPYVDITGPADIFAPHNPDEEEAHAEDEARTGVSGMGDLQLGLSSLHQIGKRSLYLSPSMWTKLPTADEDKRLGTGESDYWLRLTGMGHIGKGVWGFASGGYRWMGSSDSIPLRDRALAGVGMQYGRGPWGIGSSYDFQESSVHAADDLHELTLFGSRRIDRTQVTIYGRSGFTEASPDFAVGLQVGYDF